jgi:uncharacterized protein (DUF2147 family)
VLSGAGENPELEAFMRRLVVTVFAATLTLASGAAMAAEPMGDWRVEDGTAVIRIDNCRGALWGVVAWEKEPGRDHRSGRPTLGSPVLMNMRAASRARWEGQIYNAQSGQTYDANVRMVGDNTLRVEGCVLGGIFCGGQNWTRVANSSEGDAKSAVCARVSEAR